MPRAGCLEYLGLIYRPRAAGRGGAEHGSSPWHVVVGCPAGSFPLTPPTGLSCSAPHPGTVPCSAVPAPSCSPEAEPAAPATARGHQHFPNPLQTSFCLSVHAAVLFFAPLGSPCIPLGPTPGCQRTPGLPQGMPSMRKGPGCCPPSHRSLLEQERGSGSKRAGGAAGSLPAWACVTSYVRQRWPAPTSCLCWHRSFSQGSKLGVLHPGDPRAPWVPLRTPRPCWDRRVLVLPLGTVPIAFSWKAASK